MPNKFEDVIPQDVRDAITTVHQKCPDGYAKTYSSHEAVQTGFSLEGVDGVKMQITYILANTQSWRGDEARATKQILRSFIQ